MGLSNYITLIRNRYFQRTSLHIFQFTAIYVTGANILGLGLVLLLNRSKWYTSIARTIVFIPFIVALTGDAIVWNYVHTDIVSPLPNIVSLLGVSSQIIPAMAAIAIWRDMGYCMMIHIAALQSIPNDYYDAAKMNGANQWQRVEGITLPLIIPTIISNVTFLVTQELKCFGYPITIAKNMEAVQTVAMHVYDDTFGFNKAGPGQAATIIIIVVLVIPTYAITAVCNRLEVER